TNVKPSITANIFQKPLLLACGTGCNVNSESVFFIPIPPFLLQKKLVPEAHIQKKKRLLAISDKKPFYHEERGKRIYATPVHHFRCPCQSHRTELKVPVFNYFYYYRKNDKIGRASCSERV